jgi:hypothetical protein
MRSFRAQLLVVFLVLPLVSSFFQYKQRSDVLLSDANVLSAGNFSNFTEAQAFCDGVEQCDGFFGTREPVPGRPRWFVFVHRPLLEETVFPGMESFVKEYPIWSCQNATATCVVSTNSFNISAASSAASRLSCEASCGIIKRWACRDDCRAVNATRSTPGTYDSLEDCQRTAPKCSNTTWGWSVTTGGEDCALSTDDAGNPCVQDTSGNYGYGENCTFSFTGSARLIRTEWRLSSKGYDYVQVNDGTKYFGTSSNNKAFPLFMPVSGTTTFTFHSGVIGDYVRSSSFDYVGFKICVYPPAPPSTTLHPMIIIVLFGVMVLLIAPLWSKECETARIAVFGEFTGVLAAVCAVEQYVPPLEEIQPCHTDPSGLLELWLQHCCSCFFGGRAKTGAGLSARFI